MPKKGSGIKGRIFWKRGFGVVGAAPPKTILSFLGLPKEKLTLLTKKNKKTRKNHRTLFYF
jgi:hypothetical protein